MISIGKGGDASIMTQRHQFNFSLASTRDSLVCGAERPGHTHPSLETPRTPRGPDVSPAVVDDWITAMIAKGVKRILCLLHSEELAFYEKGICFETI